LTLASTKRPVKMAAAAVTNTRPSLGNNKKVAM
jgi:hypothetical protein